MEMGASANQALALEKVSAGLKKMTALPAMYGHSASSRGLKSSDALFMQ